MRRCLALAMVFVAALTLSACHRLVEPQPDEIDVYASFYPIYALTDAVMRDIPAARLHCLVQPQDGCLRAYQLSDWDLYLLASSDAILMGGRGLESFESALFAWGDSGPAVSAVLYNLELYGSGSESHSSDEGESHIDGPNPHLYMSVEGAKQIVLSVSAALQSMDPQYADRYVENADSAIDSLEATRLQAEELLKDCAGTRVILMNEALIYPALDYGLEVADWFDRESGTALYDDERLRCIERLCEAQAQVILIERQAPPTFVEALECAGFAVARIDIFSTHPESDGFEGYFRGQLANAEAIRAAIDKARMQEAEP